MIYDAKQVWLRADDGLFGGFALVNTYNSLQITLLGARTVDQSAKIWRKLKERLLFVERQQAKYNFQFFFLFISN